MTRKPFELYRHNLKCWLLCYGTSRNKHISWLFQLELDRG